MKSVGILLLSSLLVNASPIDPPISLARRQSGLGALFGGSSSGLSSLTSAFRPAVKKAFKIEYLSPKVKRAGAKRMRIWYGPFTIRAANATGRTENSVSMDPAGTAWNYMTDSDFPRDITVLNANSFVLFENGTLADVSYGIYNHHQMFVNLNKGAAPMASCAGSRAIPGVSGGLPLTIFMGGSEDKGITAFSTADGMFDSGFYVNKTDTIYFGGDVVNYNMEPRKVYAVGEMEYVEGRPEGFLNTGVNIIGVGQCDGISTMMQQFSGQKKYAVKAKDMVINSDGYIVAGRGHVHDGGLNILVKVNGKEVCDSKAVYGPGLGDPHAKDNASKGEWLTIDYMTQCLEPIKVSKGDKLGLEAYFDLEQHPPRPQHGGMMAETMAIMNLFFASK